MSAPTTRTAPKKQPKATETSESIQSQIDKFLNSGGEIEKIDSGVSGRESMKGPKHITLNTKPKD